jgi:hypothetical protein
VSGHPAQNLAAFGGPVTSVQNLHQLLAVQIAIFNQGLGYL